MGDPWGYYVPLISFAFANNKKEKEKCKNLLLTHKPKDVGCWAKINGERVPLERQKEWYDIKKNEKVCLTKKWEVC